MEIMKPTTVRKDIYNIFKSVVKNHSELEIPVDDQDSVVVMSKKDFLAQQELFYLQNTGTLDVVLNRMENETADDFSLEDAL
ncbi:MAG: type II toxin-antitoxin system Phd/YefM family antitoxin [Streptococcaceae bacterium]|jgi:PHD/YefM family antitoxin component YafN of YafNO toxin-antitoxin module|nr:type II toxin-antitoxin system Phd/YefM family antitoxin [Streptococcaceae bacterium]